MKLIYPNSMPKTQHFAFSIDLDFVLKIVHNIYGPRPPCKDRDRPRNEKFLKNQDRD